MGNAQRALSLLTSCSLRELVGEPGLLFSGLEPVSLGSQPSALPAGLYLPLLAERWGQVFWTRERKGGIESLLQTSFLRFGGPSLNSQPVQKENCYG